MKRSFVHLHCHSHYSLLDGASPLDKLVNRAKQSGMNALALTDHGNLYGALEFYQTANSAGIKPIIGYEAYIAPGSRFLKEAPTADQEASYHLTLLAKNRQGFQNLIKLASAAYLEGFYRKPRIDKELLAAHSEGIICLSGCVSGELSRTLLRNQGGDFPEASAKAIVEWFQGVFGDRYFLEIQNNHLEIQRLALEGTVEVARRCGVPLVATSDAHYVNQDDAQTQDVLLCINTGRFRTDTNRMRMEGDQFFLRSPEEMYAAFPGLEEAVARSQEIADSVDIQIPLGQRHFPTYPLPETKTAPDFLRELCLTALRERYADAPDMLTPSGDLAPVVLDRLERELNVINTLGFANYFLVVWDFVRFAVEQDIPCSARGSGVGAIVSYALKLSHVCPIKYDLLFERFLDISRKEAPDIDIDFCKDRRGEVIDYVKRKYGEKNVAQIGTFGTLAARAAIRDVGRAMSLPIPRVDLIVAMVPEELGITLDEALEKSADLKRSYEADPEVRELLDFARKIEGLARNVGTHAAAVVIANAPLVEYVPLQHVQGKDEVITQWAMGDVEKAGLLKMDFLGLRNLTILARAVDLIEQSTGERIDPYKFPLDDQETFALLCRGETKGIFQLEGGGIRDLLQRMKPDHFRDIIATNALYRPGPLEGGMVDEYIEVKHRRKQAEYLHDVMRDVLEETHGVMVYQEQVMRILNRLGNIELSSAYTCIKAISKKKLETIAKFRVEFIAGATDKGLSESQASNLFGMIEKFAGYGFNKSHSTAYALIAYMTAYLKAHYPVEFMAALLCGDIESRNFKKKDPLVEHLEDCRRMNITVLPPDINSSFTEFAVHEGKIHFGLAAIRGVGRAAGDALVANRQQHGPFRDLFDFCTRLDGSLINRAAIESLIKCGAFDGCGGTRAQWMAVVEKALQSGAAVMADKKRGQKGLFDDEVADEASSTVSTAMLPSVSAWAEREQLAFEREVLGFYLTSHPLAEHQATFETYCTHTSTEACLLPNRTEVVLGGMISALVFKHTKNPQPDRPSKYAMWDLEDTNGIMRCILWPDDYAKCMALCVADKILAVRGRIDKRAGSEDGKEANLIVNELIPLEDLTERFTKGVIIRIDEQRHGIRALEQLHEILRAYPGTIELRLSLSLSDGSQFNCSSETMRVAINPELQRRVSELLGTGHMRYIAAPPTSNSNNGGNGSRGGPYRRDGQYAKAGSSR